MWRQESGVMEMFIAYYEQYANVVQYKKTYREFLLEILVHHEGAFNSMKDSAIKWTGDAKCPIPQPHSLSAADEGVLESSSTPTSSQLKNVDMRLNDRGKNDDELEISQDNTVCWEERTSNFPVIKLEDDTFDLHMTTSSASTSAFPEDEQTAIAGNQHLKLIPEMCLGQSSGEFQYSTDLQSQSTTNRLEESGTVASLPEHCNQSSPHTRPFTTDFHCRYCPKTFTRRYNLTLHERTHTGDRPYLCTICQRRFLQRTHLVTHMRIHSGANPYQCSYCEMKFRHPQSLHQHELKHSLTLDNNWRGNA